MSSKASFRRLASQLRSSAVHCRAAAEAASSLWKVMAASCGLVFFACGCLDRGGARREALLF